MSRDGAEPRGVYVALDGPDGCGKSTHARSLVEHLQQQGRDVEHVREPGSTPVGESLRQLLLAEATGDLQPISEVLLFTAARAELVQRVIAPARARGAVVVAERCYLSTLVYQLLATEPPAAAADIDWFDDLTRRAHGACMPDAIFVLDVSVDVSMRRRHRRTADRIEARGADYHGRVRDGYLAAARREPRAYMFDGDGDFEHVQQQLQMALAERSAGGGA